MVFSKINTVSLTNRNFNKNNSGRHVYYVFEWCGQFSSSSLAYSRWHTQEVGVLCPDIIPY